LVAAYVCEVGGGALIVTAAPNSCIKLVDWYNRTSLLL